MWPVIMRPNPAAIFLPVIGGGILPTTEDCGVLKHVRHQSVDKIMKE